jgi:FkbM family methyltransferase
LPFGAWWFVRPDHIGIPISEGKFESAEFAFINKFLRPGMTVLDIGAHHGFYTLLAAKRVGPQGRVFSFEPSTRERKALLRHVRINGCRNVAVEGLALGSASGDAELFVVQGAQTGCNSLRKPAADVAGTLRTDQVHVVRLDDWLASTKIDAVDFIKLDVEGGELEVFKGAKKLLSGRPRPVILAEVQDVRTLPWGYRAKEIIGHLRDQGYRWFRLLPNGLLDELEATPDGIEGNFVACPGESIATLDGVNP